MNPAIPATTPDARYASFLAALLAGDKAQCRATLEAWLAEGIDLRMLYQERLQPALYAVGELWEQGRVSVATEHLATAIVESLLNLVYPRLFSQPRIDKSVVVACVANEYHQIGGKMVADFFELNGWRGYFLGANTPEQDLLDLIREKQPDAVVLSLAMPFNLEKLLHTADAVRQAAPQLPILVGGQAFRWSGQELAERIPGVRYLPSLADLETWMQTYPDHAQ
jgi:methanogenic corrinoid protein MtbC1